MGQKVRGGQGCICRLCGEAIADESQISLYSDDRLRAQCDECLPIVLSDSDGLSKFVCSECPDRVESICQYFTKVISATRNQVTALSDRLGCESSLSAGRNTRSQPVWNEDQPSVNMTSGSIDSQMEKFVRIMIPLNDFLSTAEGIDLRNTDDVLDQADDEVSDVDNTLNQDSTDAVGEDLEQNDGDGDDSNSVDCCIEQNDSSADEDVPLVRRTRTAKSRTKAKGLKRRVSMRCRCETCGQRFNSHEHLKYHERIHQGQLPFNCTLCDKAFTLKNSLDDHMFDHTGSLPFICELCGSGYKRKTSLAVHRRTAHTGERPFKCGLCTKSFSRSSVCRQHERTHLTMEERAYRCHVCPKAFTTRDKLNVHMRLHTGERPYSCEICNRTFAIKGNVSKHMRVHEAERDSKREIKRQSNPANGENCNTSDVHHAQSGVMDSATTFSLPSDIDYISNVHIKNEYHS